MVQFFLWLCFFTSLMLIFLGPVLLIGIFSLFFSMLVCYLVSVFFSSWFSGIVVVVYVGGLLVMFSYFLAVCPNEVVENKWSFTGFGVFSALVMSVGGVGYIYYVPLSVVGVSSFDMMYMPSNGAILIFLVSILLFSLFSVVSIVGLSQGPLRPFAN